MLTELFPFFPNVNNHKSLTYVTISIYLHTEVRDGDDNDDR
jgi:hypothetical protein